MNITPVTLVSAVPVFLAAGVVLQLILARALSSRLKGVLALLCSMPALGAVASLVPAVRSGAAIDVRLLPWDGPLAMVLHVDALSVLFALMGTGIGAIVLLYSVAYMAGDRSATRFYALMLTFIGGLVGLVWSANLFLMYACWELVGLCSFALVGFWYQLPEAVKGARKVLLMTHLAGYGLLAAVLILYSRTGSALWTDPAVAHAFSGGVFFLMLVALVAKSVQFPLHTWIPEAMAAPTPVSALLHAACYVKAGVYLAARMHSFGVWRPDCHQVMIGIGCVTMLVGAMYAMLQSDLKRMLAFSTVSQIGYMITGIAIGTPLAVTAALFHCLAHGFFKGGLFLAAGSVQHATGTRNMNELGGLAARMPRTTAVWLISAGCTMGVPLMSGFTGKWMLYSAALQAGFALPALAAWLASVGTVFAFAKATSEVFLGPPTTSTAQAHEAPLSMQWGLGLIGAGSLILSVAPQLAVNYLLNPVLAALGMSHAVEVSWFGLAASTGNLWSTGALVLAVVSVIVGGVVYLLAAPSHAVLVSAGPALAGATGGVFTGGEPFAGDGRLPAQDFSEIFHQQWAGFFRWSNVDRVYTAVWDGLRALSEIGQRISERLERAGALLTVVLAAAFCCWLRWGAPSIAATAISAPETIPSLLAISCAVAAAALCVCALGSAAWRRFVPLMFLSGGTASAALFVYHAGLRLALLEMAGLFAAMLVWQAAESPRVKWTFLTIVIVSGASVIGGDRLLEEPGQAAWARALLATGFLVKLAAVPLFLWLLAIADGLPALVLGTIVSVVDIAAFGEFWLVARRAVWVVEPQPVWLAVAICTALVGALLLLAQRNLKRLLVLSTVEDVGFLLLAVVSVKPLGPAAFMLGASVHALAKALLFVSLSAPEADGAWNEQSTGLASRYPVSGSAFLVGMLAMLGVPPTLGFAARWRLYESAAGLGNWVLVAFLASSVLALVAYALTLTRAWWGPAPQGPPAKEPVAVRAVMVSLMVLLLVAGLWPETLSGWLGVLR